MNLPLSISKILLMLFFILSLIILYKVLPMIFHEFQMLFAMILSWLWDKRIIIVNALWEDIGKITIILSMLYSFIIIIYKLYTWIYNKFSLYNNNSIKKIIRQNFSKWLPYTDIESKDKKESKEAMHFYKWRRYKKSFILWEHLATKNDYSAQYNVAVSYYHGRGVKRDCKRAEEWCEKSAKSNKHPMAKFHLAGLHYLDKAINPCQVKIGDMCYESAMQSFVLAQLQLALSYKAGDFFTINRKKAYIWACIAAKHNNKIAENLCKMIEKQIGIELIADYQTEITEMTEENPSLLNPWQ